MIANIQHLRAFAAIIVVLEHIFYRSESYGQAPVYLQFLKGWGLSGVDIFFVISGFVMVYSQSLSAKSPLRFMTGRIIRIVPLYWFLTLALVLLFILSPSSFRTLNPQPDHVSMSLLFLSQAVIGYAPFIDVGWTLEWEMFFYIVFSTTISFSSGTRQVIFVSVALLIISLVFGQLIILEFALGTIAACITLNRSFKRYGFEIFALGCMVLVSGIFIDLEMDRFFKWGVPAFLIVLGAASMKQYEGRFLLLLGAASYSIYLVQVVSIPLFYKLSSKLALGIDGDLLAVLCLASSVVAGYILYIVVERPLSSMFKYLIARNGPKKSG